RASILTQLGKITGLQIISVAALREGLLDSDGMQIDAILSGTIRVQGELARLVIDLVDTRTRCVLWAAPFQFLQANRLETEGSIAAEIAVQVGQALNAWHSRCPNR